MITIQIKDQCVQDRIEKFEAAIKACREKMWKYIEYEFPETKGKLCSLDYKQWTIEIQERRDPDLSFIKLVPEKLKESLKKQMQTEREDDSSINYE